MILVITVLILNFLDLLLTEYALNKFPDNIKEMNPLMRNKKARIIGKIIVSSIFIYIADLIKDYKIPYLFICYFSITLYTIVCISNIINLLKAKRINQNLKYRKNKL